jgi:hypothetical protein
MELALRDKVMLKLKNEIKNNKNNVLENLNKLNKTTDENKFLVGIKNDYEKYKTHIIDEKTKQKEFLQLLVEYKQKEFLQLLVEYIERTVEKSKITDEMNQRALLEQNKILSQINIIKNDIDEIID